MALSNIFHEPRREITESVIGVLAIVPFCYLDYRLARMMSEVKYGPPLPLAILFAAFGMILAVLAIIVALVVTHEIGDWICNRLQDAGLHLRPRNRYR